MKLFRHTLHFASVTSHRQASEIGSIWERGKDLTRLKNKKHWVDFYHYRVVVYTHWQHTFQFKQLVKVHVASNDPFNNALVNAEININ